MGRYDRGYGRDPRPPFPGPGSGGPGRGYDRDGPRGPGGDPFAGGTGAFRRWEPVWDGHDRPGFDGGFAHGHGGYGGYGGGGGAFVPEDAYRGHYGQEHGHGADSWDDDGAEDRPLTDDEVARCVCEAMERDSWLETDRIQVQVSEGVVTLTGEVNDYMEARYAWDDAWEADGVRGVVSQLVVNPREDDEIEGDGEPQEIETER